jgi:hypothetical protein
MIQGHYLQYRCSLSNKVSALLLPGGGGERVCADVLVSETFGDDPLAERFLVSLKDAANRLLAPSARVVPCCLAVSAVLISSNHVRSLCCPPQSSGLWTHLAISRASVRLAEVPHTALSRTFSAFTMDWDVAAGGHLVVPELRGGLDVEVEVVVGGEAHGFVFWFDIGMVSRSSGSIAVSTAPDAAAMRFASLPSSIHACAAV